MLSVREFWSNYEATAETYEDLHRQISHLSNSAKKQKRTIVWRGQSNADWPLTSRLYRAFLDTKPSRLTENAFAKIEQNILVELRHWGLHSQRNSGRLSILSQLAMLQHFGTPTRLIDISFNALVAAFFASEASKTNDDEDDGRLFAIDITDRIINETKQLRPWEDSLDTPWSNSFKSEQYDKFIYLNPSSELDKKTFVSNWDHEWSSHYFAWKPPALDDRISAQNGGFILGGIVGAVFREGYLDTSAKGSDGAFQIANPTPDGSTWLPIDDVRQLTCLAAKPQSFPAKSIRSNTKNAVYSIRIESKAKDEIRDKLENIFGYTHATIYPDFPGFAVHGAKKIVPY